MGHYLDSFYVSACEFIKLRVTVQSSPIMLATGCHYMLFAMVHYMLFAKVPFPSPRLDLTLSRGFLLFLVAYRDVIDVIGVIDAVLLMLLMLLMLFTLAMLFVLFIISMVFMLFVLRMVITYRRVWINRVRLPILLLVS